MSDELPNRRRTKAEVDELAFTCWERHVHNAPVSETMNKFGVSKSYYYRLLERAAKYLQVEFGDKSDLALFRVVEWYNRQYRLCMKHFEAAERQQNAARENNDSKLALHYDQRALSWLDASRKALDALCDFLFKSGLLQAKPKRVEVSLTPFEEALLEVNKANAAGKPLKFDEVWA